ncbi:MAG: helix-turn-helix domain-containing protein [Paludibacteraceae bacterium]
MLKTFSDLVISDNLDEICFAPETVTNYLILLYCETGILQVTLNDETFLVTKNHLLVCMPQCLLGHYMRTPDFHCKLLCVGEHLFDEVLADCFHMEPHWWEKQRYVQHHPVAALTDYQCQLMDAYFRLLCVYAEDRQTPYRQRVIRTTAQAAAFEILGGMETMAIAHTDNERMTQTGQKDHVFHQFMTLLNKPDNTEREVRWYADKLLLTPKYLSAVCKEKSGRTASEWIHKITIGHIRHYLLQTELSIKEIAYRMDFPDVSFFCKFTKKHLGMAPLDYRKNNKE